MLEVSVLNQNEHFQETVKDKSFSIGSCDAEYKNAIVINDGTVSKFQCLIELIEDDNDGRIKITNLGGSMVLGNNSRIHHLITREETLPCSLGAGDTQIQIHQSSFASEIDNSIQSMPNVGSSSQSEIADQKNKNKISPSPETLTSWFESLGQIQRSTAGQKQFFKLAARNVFNPGGLDGCIVLRKNHDDWKVEAQHIPYPESGICFRKDLVEQAAKCKLPIFHNNALLQDIDTESDIHAAVVCPVLDSHEQVTAIVYGFRNCYPGNSRKGIRLLEAKFVSLIADSIAAGIIRLDQEADRARQRILLEQAFSAEVVNQLESNPEILHGRESEVSVLFADLRGFCQISESIGAKLTYQLLTDVMDRFTNIIHQQNGVVIDFYGDGLSAFWNAPVKQANHATLACNAGLAIERAMAELNDTWSLEIGHRLRVGVGIHTGTALVGNSGSQNRLKYGPQGTTVNIASRIEQATKKLCMNVIVSGATAARVEENYITQRICTAKLGGIRNNVDLVRLVDPKQYSQMADFFNEYSRALGQFDAGNYLETFETLTELSSSEFDSDPMLAFLLGELTERLESQKQASVRNTPSTSQKSLSPTILF